MSIAGAGREFSTPGIRVLALDGGGIRGLSSLVVLRVLMERIAVKVQATATLRPCDYFDLIIGTGTGGLSALFLGRMRMSVDEAIESYLLIGKKGLKRPTVPLFHQLWHQEAIFDADSVAHIIGDIVQRYLGDREVPLQDTPFSIDVRPRSCRTAVIATSIANVSDPPHVFRSYRTNLDPASTHAIHKVARATLATAGVFPPISLGFPPIKFIEAGVAGYNNPAEVALLEVGRISLSAKIDCLVSLGTGLQSVVSVGDSWRGLMEVSTKLMEDCEKVHERLLRRHSAGLPYYRFNVVNGLDHAGIREWNEETSGIIAGITEGYTRKTDVDGLLNSCVSLLISNIPDTSIGQATEARSSPPHLKTIRHGVLAEKIFAWLKAPDSSLNYNEAREKHREGTGKWVLDGETFREWQKKPESGLFIYGKPGCGKTVLCSSIISHISDVCQRDKSCAYAYYFFDGRDAQEALQHHDGLIRSLIEQFSDQCDGIPLVLAELYGSGHRQPPTDALEHTLHHILGGFSHTYIIIDALDECTEKWKLLKWIKNLACCYGRTYHLLATSRPDEDTMANLQGFDGASIYIEDQEMDGDIAAYIDWKIDSEHTLNRWDRIIQTKIKDRLTGSAQGTFRWVALQLEELQRCPNKAGLYAQLERLPKDLDEIYFRTLINIDEQRRSDALTFLQWVAFSVRPLTIEEIAEAAAFDLDPENGPRYNPDRVYPVREDVLATCSNLLVKIKANHEEKRRWYPDRKDEVAVVKLSHFSVKEYLISERISQGGAKYFSINERLSHLFIANACLAYLNRFDRVVRVEPLEDVKLSTYTLARYTARNWVYHARLGGNDSEATAQKLIMTLLESEIRLTNWIRLWDPDDPYGVWTTNPLLRKIPGPLYYASLLGFSEILRRSLEDRVGQDAGQRKEIDSIEGLCGTALIAASLYGHTEIVKLLLDHGANINAKGLLHGTALQAASSNGYVKVVELLLERGADANSEGGGDGTALIAASLGGHMEIAKLLLDRGVEVDAKRKWHGTALQAASGRGFTDVVKFLIEQGADVNAEAGRFGTALIGASFEGHFGIARLLLDLGANVNAKGTSIGPAIQAASGQGRTDVVKLLLEYGADVNAEGGNFGTALIRASFGGNVEVIRLLLDFGANVNAKGQDPGPAIQTASCEGHTDVVKMLLEHGADVNAEAGRFGTALIGASFRGHIDTVRLLCAHGANVDVNAKRYSTAIQAASGRGHTKIVEVLLEHGAIVSPNHQKAIDPGLTAPRPS